MKLSGPVFLASIGLSVTAVTRAADATTPVEVGQRNSAMNTAATITPATNTPAVDHAVQDRRVETTTLDKTPAAIGARRAAIDVSETRDKQLQPITGRKPEVRTVPRNEFNQRMGSVSTSADGKPPERMSRYQTSLAAASESNMARFPASSDRAAGKINRFVFRKNPPETPIAMEGAPVTPAAGGPTLPK
jgi:hypothetical protein